MIQIEPVADLARMAFSVLWNAPDPLSLSTPPRALNQRSFKIGKICCSDRGMDSPRLQLIEASNRCQSKCIRFEHNLSEALQ